jgi:hypothetical protein
VRARQVRETISALYQYEGFLHLFDSIVFLPAKDLDGSLAPEKETPVNVFVDSD